MNIYLEDCHENVLLELKTIFKNIIILESIDECIGKKVLALKNLNYLPFDPRNLISSALSHKSQDAFSIHLSENSEHKKLFLIDENFQIINEGPLNKNYKDGYELGQISFHEKLSAIEHIVIPPKHSNFFPQGAFLSKKNLLKVKPALFLDRDGIINHDKGYIYQYSEIEWIEEAIQLIKLANKAGYKVFVLTNQSGVSQGFYREEDVLKLHKEMNEYLNSHSAFIDNWYYAPYSFRNSIPNYKYYSLTRKPGAGMMLQALSENVIDIKNSIMIGDKNSDHLILDGVKYFHYRGKYNLEDVSSPVVNSLLEINQFINS